MRKYIHFIASILFALVFSLSHTQSAYAVIEGGLCNGDTTTPYQCIPAPDTICYPLDCDAGLKCVSGICRQDGVAPGPGTGSVGGTQCSCVNEGQAGSGKNGFTCGGGPVAYCGSADQACYRAGPEYILPKSSTGNGDEVYPNITIKGVRCDAQGQADCTCNTPNIAASGQNGMTCKIAGQPDGTGFCDQAGDACVPGGSMDEDGTEQLGEDHGGIYDNRTLLGVHCGQPEAQCTCDNPGTAGSGENGITCKFPGIEDGKGFCDDQSAACISGGQMDEDGTEQLGEDAGGRYNDMTLIGVHCGPGQEPTVPPPPSPPCTEGQWQDGKCASLITAFGELQTDPSGFVTRLFAILLSFSGGIALLLIIKAGYQMMTSQGKPEQLQAGRDQLIAAVVGLVFLIFSLVLLQVIGYDILRIPEFAP